MTEQQFEALKAWVRAEVDIAKGGRMYRNGFTVVTRDLAEQAARKALVDGGEDE